MTCFKTFIRIASPKSEYQRKFVFSFKKLPMIISTEPLNDLARKEVVMLRDSQLWMKIGRICTLLAICILLMMWSWNCNQQMESTEFISRNLLAWICH